jgi:hypothetical protein
LSTIAGRTPAKVTNSKQGSKGKVLPPANRHPQLVSDWVEVFAPMIWATYAPTAWPAALAIDEMEFRHGRLGRPRGDKAFSVLCAVGYGDFQQSGGRPYVAAIEAVPRADSQAWSRLLGSLEGRPAWVVGDGGHPLATAAALWARIDVNLGEDPGFRTWRCEWHLARSIIQAGGIHLTGLVQVRTLATVEPLEVCPRSEGGHVALVVRAGSSSAAGRRPGRGSAPARGRRRVPAPGRRSSLCCEIDVG